MSDGSSMYLSKGDIEGRERWLVDNRLGVDEEPTIILCFEELIVISVGIRGVVEEDDLQMPTQSVLLVGSEHSKLYLINITFNRYIANNSNKIYFPSHPFTSIIRIDGAF